MRIKIWIPLILLLLLPQLEAMPGTGKLARETSGYIVRKFGKSAAGEGLETTVAKLIRKHGEEIAPLLRKHGPPMIHLMEEVGSDALPLIRKFGNEGIEVLVRSGNRVLAQVRRYGDDAMEIAIRHRGVGENLIAELGEEGIRLGRKLSTEEVVQTLRLLPELKKQNGVSIFVRAVDRHGSAVFRYLGEHPEVAAGGGARALLAAKQEIVVGAGALTGTGIGRGVRAA